jgi:hypothetical protein
MRHLVTIAIACTSGLAAADTSPDVRLAAEPQTRTIRAELAHVPRMNARSIVLRAGGALAPATRVRTFAESGEPVAIAIVYNGSELWIGSDDIEKDDNARYFGALHGLADAIDRVDFARVLPAGSTATLVNYSIGARVRLLALAPIAQLHGAALGTQSEYFGKVGQDLVEGVELALHELAKSSARDKYLVVIGDGTDTEAERAKRRLPELAKRAARERVDVRAIVYRTSLDDAPIVVTKLAHDAKFINSIDGMHAALADVADAMSDRYEVTFDARDLPWDGSFHQAVVWLDRDELPGETLQLADLSTSTPWWRARWLVELGLGFAFVVVIAGALRLRYTLGR